MHRIVIRVSILAIIAVVCSIGYIERRVGKLIEKRLTPIFMPRLPARRL